MRKVILFSFLIFISSFGFAQDNIARWLRFPSISPDGQTIAFGYMGNIYKVNAKGGVAIPLTMGEAYYTRPVWSHDGQTLAFSSDRYGNFDVYTMPADGGQATRLTFHSADDYAYDFTPDNTKVLIGSKRAAPASSVRFPGKGYFANLYTIPVDGGRPILVTAAGADRANYSPDGSKIIFQNSKGYEDYYRKHEHAAITPDIWIYNVTDNSYTQVTNNKINDRSPNFVDNGQAFVFTNGASGDLNIYKQNLISGAKTQLTQLKDFPVRSLTVANSGKMAFTWKGDVYTLIAGQTPQKLTVRVLNNTGFNTFEHKDIKSVTQFDVSPNGKEIAFINRGEVFVTAADNSHTKRITNTPQQERMVSWSPDGKYLVFAGEREGDWDIYKTTLAHPEEKFFYAATTLKTEPLVATEAQEFQPKISPDGKKIAYVKNRNILVVMDLESKEKTAVLPKGHNFSYTDGDWGFDWSPDSQWLLVDDSKGYFSKSNTALIAADGQGEIVYPVNSGFGESDAKWALDGKMMTYKTTKYGRSSLAYQGSHEEDIYAVFFDQEAYDHYTMSEDEHDLMKARQDEEKDKEDKKDKKKSKKKDEKEAVEPLELDLNNLDHRLVRLTINSAGISDYVLNEDGSKLYYLAAFEDGYDLWVTEPRTRKTKILAKLGTSGSKLEISEDGKTIFMTKGSQLIKIDTDSGKVTSINVDGEMTIDHDAERHYIFNHMWRQMKDRFYAPDMDGVDWKMYHDAYAQFLPYINNNFDFKVLLSEMLGELNASHTGARYYPRYENAEHTASLGVLYDQNYKGEGLKITEILTGGPLASADSEAQVGDVIVKINNHKIAAGENWIPYLTNLRGKNVRLTFKRGKDTFSETIKPISLGKQNSLMYNRWVSTMERLTDSLSGGRLGYVHVKGMNDQSFREVYDKVLGEYADKDALIVDTRFNGGGWLHNDLNTFLSGQLYLKFRPQGQHTKGGEPVDRWKKPSVMLISEGNYSDAYITPYIYKQNGIGKLIGMPVAGTGTAVWWETQIDPTLIFGIPMVATVGDEGRPTENLELEPDIKVDLPYSEFLQGEDAQLEAGVQELLRQLGAEE